MATLIVWTFPRYLQLLMKFKLFGIYFSVSFPAVAFLSIALIADNKGTFIVCLISSFLHELGHLLALRITGAKIDSVRFNLGDVAIKADYSKLSSNAEIVVSLSGVLVNLLLSIVGFLFWQIFSTEFLLNVIISNLLIAAFNLLPVRFLDGGQVILLILQKFLDAFAAEKIVNILTVVFLIPIAIAGFVFVFNSSYNFSLLFVALYIICTLVSKEFKNVS